jgi:O-antigen ligase
VTLACVRTLREAAITLLLLCSGSIAGTLVALVTHATQGAGRMLVFYSDNPNRLGYPSAYMIPLVLLAVVWLWRDGRRALACAAAVVLGYLLLWPLMASGSRSATLGTIAALGVFVLAKPPVTLRQLVTRAVGLGLLLAALVQTLLASSLFPPTLQERLLASTDPTRRDTLVGDRERLAEAGTKAFLDSPFLGVGLDNFRYVALQYEPSATPQQPHNLWLQLLAQVGLLGAIGFFVLVAVWVARLALVAHAPGHLRDRELVWACVSSMVGVLTVMMAIPIMIDRHYWLIYGVGLAMIGIVDRHRRGLVGS